MNAYLILEDGTVFKGRHIGAEKDAVSEVVFNTSMTGYTEVFSDPSYAGQAVCMTYPLIGNYGVCLEDMESERIWPDAIIVREMSRLPSNFRMDLSLEEYLEKFSIPGIEGIDTRCLVRILREKGTMNGFLTTSEHFDKEEVISRLHQYTTGRVVEKVTCSEIGYYPGNAFVRDSSGRPMRRVSVALLDLGAKYSIIRNLTRRGCDVTVYPALTPAEKILEVSPDGIMLSNGPGDPKECTSIIEQIKLLSHSGIPVFAICLGHQLIALSEGADTHKLHYGHRGSNHPVKNTITGKVYISSQNHGYVVDTDRLDPSVAIPSFINVNDGTNEGLNYTKLNVETVQFHPEASAGPHDSSFLFDRFVKRCRDYAAVKNVKERGWR